MDIQSAGIKFFVADPKGADLEPVLGIFHGWIQEEGRGLPAHDTALPQTGSLPRAGKELLIDVADYRHVQHGPGVVLVAHEANYSMDNTGGRLGLLYQRKASMNGDVQKRLRQVARAALLACQRIESEPALEGSVKFEGQELQLVINDRMLAPNSAETFAALEPELRRLCDTLYGGGAYALARTTEDPRERFTVLARAEKPVDVGELLWRLG